MCRSDEVEDDDNDRDDNVQDLTDDQTSALLGINSDPEVVHVVEVCILHVQQHSEACHGHTWISSFINSKLYVVSGQRSARDILVDFVRERSVNPPLQVRVACVGISSSKIDSTACPAYASTRTDKLKFATALAIFFTFLSTLAIVQNVIQVA
jgi:hypothetical protein